MASIHRLLLVVCAARGLQQSALHEAVRIHRADHREECDRAAARYEAPRWVVADAAAVEGALESGGYREADVWAAERVFPAAETRSLVEEIEAQDAGWSTDRHRAWQASGAVADLPLAYLPGVTAWLARNFKSTIAPLVARVAPALVDDADDLRVADAFVVRYRAGGGADGDVAALPAHVDGGLVSVNIGLNAAFEGGGTRFERTGSVVGGGDGSVAIHPSAMRHAGEPISAGVRLILVVFCISARRPEMCRRFTHEGLEAARRGDSAASTLAFRRATKFDSTNVAARHNLAMDGLVAGGFDGLKAAATSFHRCICLEGGDDCKNVEVIARLGETLHALGAYAEALDISDWALDVAPRHFNGHAVRVASLASLLRADPADADGRRRDELADALRGADGCSAANQEEYAALVGRVGALLA